MIEEAVMLGRQQMALEIILVLRNMGHPDIGLEVAKKYYSHDTELLKALEDFRS